MNDNEPLPLVDAQMLAALKAVRPDVEELKAERNRLDRELKAAKVRERKAVHEAAQRQVRESSLSSEIAVVADHAEQLRGEVARYEPLPDHIWKLKVGAISVLAVAAASLAYALFNWRSAGWVLIVALLAGLIVAGRVVLTVEKTELEFGRWQFSRKLGYVFKPIRRR